MESSQDSICSSSACAFQSRLSLHWQCCPLLPAWLLPAASSGPCVWLDVSQSQQIRQRARGRFVISVPEIHPEWRKWWLVQSGDSSGVQLLRLPVPVLEDTHILFNSLALCLCFWSVFSLFSTRTWCPSLKGSITQKVLYGSDFSAWSQVPP